MEENKELEQPIVEEPQKEEKQENVDINPYKKERERGKTQLAKKLGFNSEEEVISVFGDLKNMASQFAEMRKEAEELKAQSIREGELKELRKLGFDEEFLDDTHLILANTPEDRREAKQQELLKRFGVSEAQNQAKNELQQAQTQSKPLNVGTTPQVSGEMDLATQLAKWRKGEL